MFDTLFEFIFNQIWQLYWRFNSFISVFMPIFWRITYNLCNKIYNNFQNANNMEIFFLNYGYSMAADGAPKKNSKLDKYIKSKEEQIKNSCPDDFNKVWSSVQLYVSMFGAYDRSLVDASILEVGCGRGGGSVVINALEPGIKLYTGIDISDEAISSCLSKYNDDLMPLGKKTFTIGNSMNLISKFPLNSYDIVLNVESCHCYGDYEKFFSQVYSILKDEGHFLITDICPVSSWYYISKSIEKIGFEIEDDYDISKNVLESLNKNNSKYFSQIHLQNNNSILSKAMLWVANFQAVHAPHKALENGSGSYHIIIAKKPKSRVDNENMSFNRKGRLVCQ